MSKFADLLDLNGYKYIVIILDCTDELPYNLYDLSECIYEDTLIISPSMAHREKFLSIPSGEKNNIFYQYYPGDIEELVCDIVKKVDTSDESYALFHFIPKDIEEIQSDFDTVIMLISKENYADTTVGLSLIMEENSHGLDFASMLSQDDVPVEIFISSVHTSQGMSCYFTDPSLLRRNLNALRFREKPPCNYFNLVARINNYSYLCLLADDRIIGWQYIVQAFSYAIAHPNVDLLFFGGFPNSGIGEIDELSDNIHQVSDKYIENELQEWIIVLKSCFLNDFQTLSSEISRIQLEIVLWAASKKVNYDVYLGDRDNLYFLPHKGTGIFARIFKRDDEDIWRNEFKTDCPKPLTHVLARKTKQNNEILHIDRREAGTSPFISVITVCKNIEKVINLTLDSVVSQDFADFEYIVVDGGSTDSTLEIIQAYGDVVDVLVSGNDGGIYQGMNKGVALARGEYLIMMNGGDEFHNPASLSALAGAARSSEADVVAGQSVVRTGDRKFRNIHITPHNAASIVFGNPCNHQAMLYKSELHNIYGVYNINYKISADYDFILTLLINGATFYFIRDFVSYFYYGGISSSHTYSRFHDLLNIRKKIFPFVDKYDQGFFAAPWAYQSEDILRLWRKYQGISPLFDASISAFYHYRQFHTTLPEFDRICTLKEMVDLPLVPLEVAYIIGNGPSLKGFNLQQLNGQPTFGMNAAYRFWDLHGWYPQYYSCLDPVTGISHIKAIERLILNRKQYGIKRFLLRTNIIDALGEIKHLDCIDDFDELRKIFPRLFASPITTGSHTLAWAAYLGYRYIVLLGIDAQYTNFLKESRRLEGIRLKITSTPDKNPNYFFDDYQQTGDIYQIPNAHPDNPTHISAWHPVATALSRLGAFVINANIHSAVNDFQKASFQDALDLFTRWRIVNYFPRAYAKIRDDLLDEGSRHEPAKSAFVPAQNTFDFANIPEKYIQIALLSQNPELAPKTVEIYLELESVAYMDVHLYGTFYDTTEQYPFGEVIRLEPNICKKLYLQIPKFTLSSIFSLRLAVHNYPNKLIIHRFLFAETFSSVENTYEGSLGVANALELYEKGDCLAALAIIAKNNRLAPNSDNQFYAQLCARQMGMPGSYMLKPVDVYPAGGNIQKTIAQYSELIRSNFRVKSKSVSIIVPLKNITEQFIQSLTLFFTGAEGNIEIILCVENGAENVGRLQTLHITIPFIHIIYFAELTQTMEVYLVALQKTNGAWLHFAETDHLPMREYYEEMLIGEYASWDLIKSALVHPDSNVATNGYTLDRLLAINNDAFVDDYESALFSREYFLNVLKLHSRDHCYQPNDFTELLPYMAHGNIKCKAIKYVCGQTVGSDIDPVACITCEFDRLLYVTNYIYLRKDLNPELYSKIAVLLVDKVFRNCEFAFTKPQLFIELYFRFLAISPKLIFYPYFDNKYLNRSFYRFLQALQERIEDNIAYTLSYFYDKESLSIYINRNLHKKIYPTQKVGVVIISHRESLSENEILSLRQCMNIFRSRPIYICCSTHFDTRVYTDVAAEFDTDCRIIRMDPVFFHVDQTRQLLMRTPQFYNYFTDFEYVLTYQLDCWVFRDDLDNFCESGYDYLCAPLVEECKDISTQNFILPEIIISGLMMTKVSAMIKCIYMQLRDDLMHNYKSILSKPYISDKKSMGSYLTSINSEFKTAPEDICMEFAFGAKPRQFYEKIKKLPCCCKGYVYHDKEFWSKFIPIAEE